jgi:hypothetical protein
MEAEPDGRGGARGWKHYIRAKEAMLHRPHIPKAPRWVVEAVDNKRAPQLILHLLTQVPYGDVHHETVILPDRVHEPAIAAREFRNKCTCGRASKNGTRRVALFSPIPRL